MFNKYIWVGIGIIFILMIVKIVMYKNDISDLNIEIKNQSVQIDRLSLINKNLASSIIDLNKDIEKNELLIASLNDKFKKLNESLTNEISVWEKKYDFCISGKLGSDSKDNLKDKNGALNEDSSSFYIDLYNDNIFK